MIDDDGEAGTLSLADEQGIQLLPTIVERAVLARLAHQGQRWAISGSPRNWYEKQPIREKDGISVIRRASIASMFVEDVGVGIAADVQTAFFTTQTLDWFLPLTGTTADIRHRRDLFDRLAQREHGKGTLVYHRGETRTTCYFTRAPEGSVCGSTGSFRLNNVTYDSVYDYYSKTAPQLRISSQDRAVWVSFPKAKGDVPVAAKLLRLRVFNDVLPEALKLLIPMPPRDRRAFVFSFWHELGADVLASLGATFEDGLWSPAKGRFWQIPPPPLRFGKNKVLQSPARESDYRTYYGNRIKMLREGGCFQFPAATPRRIQCAYPALEGEQAVWPAPVAGADLRGTRVFWASYFADFLRFVSVPCILVRSSMPLIISSPITFSTESCNVQPKTWATRPIINGLHRMESCNGGTPSSNAGMACGW